MIQGKRELIIRCVFAENEESLRDILRGCFQVFLCKEIQKGAEI